MVVKGTSSRCLNVTLKENKKLQLYTQKGAHSEIDVTPRVSEGGGEREKERVNEELERERHRETDRQTERGRE